MRLLLDTGILGRLCHPRIKQHRPFTAWLSQVLSRQPLDTSVVLPEIADYELRRKLLHLVKRNPAAHGSIERLDRLSRTLDYLPISTAAMRRAAALWADSRHRGLPTTSPDALDGDVILAAQALEIDATIVTTNRRHLSRFVAVIGWEEIM